MDNRIDVHIIIRSEKTDMKGENMIHDTKTRELIERYCSGLDRNVIVSRRIGDEKCECLHRDVCKLVKGCKYAPEINERINVQNTSARP